MAEQRNVGVRATNNRWRWATRLSLRALLLLPVIAGLYFAGGKMTAARGEREVSRYLAETEDRPLFKTDCVAPFVFSEGSLVASPAGSAHETMRQRYYVWFFGFVARLPIESRHAVAFNGVEIAESKETYFPVISASSRHKTVVPVSTRKTPSADVPLEI